MPAGDPDPIVERRRLRAELRRLRQDRDLTQRDVAQAMDWSTSKLIRIEQGDVRISPNDLRVLLSHYGVSDEQQVQELLAIARAARRESWTEFRDVLFKSTMTYFGFESSARQARIYELTLVPGLLQTEEYARAVLAAYVASADTRERLWAARQRRQELHERANPPQMSFMLDEGVVRRQVGGRTVMRRQLERLRQWVDEPHITIQVISFEAGAHSGMRGPFAVLDLPSPPDQDVVWLEDASGDSRLIEDPEQTGEYLERFFRLEDIALSPVDTVALIDDAIEQLKQTAQATRG